MRLIRKGVKADQDFSDAQAEEKKFRAAALSGAGDASLDDWEQALETMKDRRALRDRSFNEAIALTLKYYGLKQQGDGLVRDWPGAGLRAHWSPRFVARDASENTSLTRAVDLADVTPSFWTAHVGGDIRARTWGDGRVDVYIETFQDIARNGKTPWSLALDLYHESVHFDDLTGPGRGGPNADEYHAYSASLSAADALGAPDSAKTKLQKLRTKFRLLALAETIAPGHFRRFATGVIQDVAGEEARQAWYAHQRDLDRISGEQKQLQDRLDGEREQVAREVGSSDLEWFAVNACHDDSWMNSAVWSSLVENIRHVVVSEAPPRVITPGASPVTCRDYLTNQIDIQLANHTLQDRDVAWAIQLARDARKSDRAYWAAYQMGRWVKNECVNGSLPDDMTDSQLSQAYTDLAPPQALADLWAGPYYTGIPCPTLLLNFVYLDKRLGRPFRDSNDWFNIARLANVRSRSGPPPTPPAAPPASDGPGTVFEDHPDPPQPPTWNHCIETRCVHW
ncbi:MAG: hypothetical protein KGL53_10840 [Elusimicrobia bacterium]|nr:hypothetical protein [Elusimicrobiota bacterium]